MPRYALLLPDCLYAEAMTRRRDFSSPPCYHAVATAVADYRHARHEGAMYARRVRHAVVFHDAALLLMFYRDATAMRTQHYVSMSPSSPLIFPCAAF